MIKKPKPTRKYVRIDHRTIIEVSVDISDEDARERYLKRQQILNPNTYEKMRVPKKILLDNTK